MNYESMKVFRDGNQLVIVLENAGKELEGMVMSMIGGNIPKVEHLSPPAPIPKERPDIENMKEMSQAKPAKFIQENRRSGDHANRPVGGRAYGPCKYDGTAAGSLPDELL